MPTGDEMASCTVTGESREIGARLSSQLVEGGLYRVRSRYLQLGVFDGHRGFIGIRCGHRYLVREYLNDGGPFGTVTAPRAFRWLSGSVLRTNSPMRSSSRLGVGGTSAIPGNPRAPSFRSP